MNNQGNQGYLWLLAVMEFPNVIVFKENHLCTFLVNLCDEKLGKSWGLFDVPLKFTLKNLNSREEHLEMTTQKTK